MDRNSVSVILFFATLSDAIYKLIVINTRSAIPQEQSAFNLNLNKHLGKWWIGRTYHYRIYLKFLPPPPLRRQAWALVSVVGGGNGSCVEEVREHENHDTGGKALARRDFVTVDGVRFFVSAYSEWWNGKLQNQCRVTARWLPTVTPTPLLLKYHELTLKCVSAVDFFTL